MRGVLYEKRNETILAGSVALLSLVVAGCSQSKSTSEAAKETTEATSEVTTQVASNTKKDANSPAASFDWNAKVAPLTKYEQTLVESNSGKTNYPQIGWCRKSSTDLE